MANTNGSDKQNGTGRTRVEEISHLIETRDWDALNRFLGLPVLTADEVERILREEPQVDAAEVNRKMEELDRIDDQRSMPVGDCQ